MRRTDQLWGRGLDALFPPHAAPSVMAPWPATSWNRSEPGFERATVEATLRLPPQLIEVDPRVLWANQPRVTRAGVDYYVHDHRYQRLGRTYADRHQIANRFPFIYRRRDGQLVILGGHHRSAAALLTARPLLAIMASSAWGDR